MRKIVIFLAFMAMSAYAFSQEKNETPAMILSLKQAIKLADGRNTQLLVANERVQQALAEISASRSALLPQLAGVFGGKRQTSDLRATGIGLPGDPHVGPYNSFDTRARMTMTIFDLSALGRLESAKAGQKLSQSQAIKLRQDIMALVASMYLKAQRASQSIEANQINVRHLQHQYDILKRRLDQGMASSIEVDQAKLALAQGQFTLQESMSYAQKARLDLASALKIPLDQAIIFQDDTSWLEKEFTQAQSLPDLEVAKAQWVQSKAELSAAQGAFFPKLSAMGDYGRLGESPRHSSNTYSLGLSLTLPIWEGGLRQADLAQAKSKLSQSQLLLEEAQDEADVKIRQAREDLSQARALLIYKFEQMQYAQHQWEIAQRQLSSGLANQLDLDHAEANKALSIDENNEALATYWTAKIYLAHAMGNLDQLFELGFSPQGG